MNKVATERSTPKGLKGDPTVNAALKVNLGCGAHVPDGWINVDYSIGAWLAKVPFFGVLNRRFKLFRLSWHPKIYLHDLRKRFPWGNDSVDIIFSSHTLEHLSRAEGIWFLQECHRVLRPNGIIRIVVPDVSVLIGDYITGTIKADELIDRLGASYVEDKDGLFKRVFAPLVRFPHRCMYDSKTLRERLAECGFSALDRSPHDSEIPGIGEIESLGRTRDAVIVEGRKLSPAPRNFA